MEKNRVKNEGRMTKIFTFLVGQGCRSALNAWAPQQLQRRRKL